MDILYSLAWVTFGTCMVAGELAVYWRTRKLAQALAALDAVLLATGA